MKNVKKISLMLVIILLMIVFVGCNKSDYAHLPKEDQEIYLELYTLYDIVRKGYEGEIELPIKDKKTLDTYTDLWNKYRSLAEDDKLNHLQEEIWYNILFVSTSPSENEKRPRGMVEEIFNEIEQTFESLKN